MTLDPGTRLGPYEIRSLLGVGGMGEVYRARDTRLERDVAVKIIPRELARDRRRVKRFELEARAAGALHHPNVVSIFDVGVHRGTRFVVMELAEGRTLRELLQGGQLGLGQAIDVAIQAVEGLEAAHAKGIVHRDLTPGNLIVTSEGRVKVLDFGLAKREERTPASGTSTRPLGGHAPAPRKAAARGDTSVSEAGTVVGTVPYMAPEQLRGERVDARTDLFALGILLYEMITGQRPFQGGTSAEVASAILRDLPAPARSLRADLPDEVEQAIDRCLEKNPERRFASARDVGQVLRAAARRLAGRGASSRKEGAPGLDEGPAVEGGVTTPDSPQSNAASSIAVLPFANRSQDDDDEYFSDGLADELLNVLAKIQGLHVVGRTSSYQFKGTTEDLRAIGRRLNVATLLEGSVRRTGSRVRINVQLVKVADGFQLWSESYDRTLDDIFAVQDDIAQSVVKELRTMLLGGAPDSKAGAAARADVAVAVRGRGEGGEAYRLFLRGRYFVNRSTREDVVRGIGYLLESLQTDPRLALAWAELSGAYAIEAGYGWVPVEPAISRARQAAERALAIEPELPEGHVRLGAIQMNFEWNWSAAEESYRRALAAAPGNALVLRLAGNLASNMGRLEEAIGLYRRAVDQDPLSPAGYQSLGIAYFSADRLNDAERAFRTSLELAPQRLGPRYGLALVLSAQGRAQEAAAMAAAEPEEVFRLLASSVVAHQRGAAEESLAFLRTLQERYAEGGAFQIAEACAARGERDAAFAWLDKAYEQRDGGMVEMKSEPLLRSLHEDPRWGDLLMRMGLPVPPPRGARSC